MQATPAPAAPSFPTPIVSPDWLAAHLGEPRLVVLDASWYLPQAGRDPRAEFLAGHLPGARFFDLDRLSDPASDLPHTLPGPTELAAMLGGLGIGEHDRVVVYDGSGANLSAARAWWMLRVAGHDAVSVLDGGLAAWRAEGRPLEPGAVVPMAAAYPVRRRLDLLATQGEVRALAAGRSVQLVDARATGRFEGTEPEPRPGLRGGHIPGARNLPFTELVGPDGRLLPAPRLRARFAAAGVDPSRPVVCSCGSGVSACAVALALAVLGWPDAAVYDGSWAEWGRAGGPPAETGPAAPATALPPA